MTKTLKPSTYSVEHSKFWDGWIICEHYEYVNAYDIVRQAKRFPQNEITYGILDSEQPNVYSSEQVALDRMHAMYQPKEEVEEQVTKDEMFHQTPTFNASGRRETDPVRHAAWLVYDVLGEKSYSDALLIIQKRKQIQNVFESLEQYLSSIPNPLLDDLG